MFPEPESEKKKTKAVSSGKPASGQCLCSVNCPMVVAARYGYSVPPSEACIRTKQNRAIWVRLSPIVLRAPHGAICAILVLATDVSRYKLTEQLVRWIASRLDAGDDSSTFAVGDAATKLRTCFPDLTQRESEVLWEAVIGKGYHEIATALACSRRRCATIFNASSPDWACTHNDKPSSRQLWLL